MNKFFMSQKIQLFLLILLLVEFPLFAGNSPAPNLQQELNTKDHLDPNSAKKDVVIIKNADGTSLETLHDGTKILHNNDGSSVQTNPDGTNITKNIDGSMVIRSPNGAVVVKNIDGSSVKTNPDGTKKINNSDGSSVQINHQ